MSLVIPNTATTAADTNAGAAVFPGIDGGLTPYVSGYLFVANSSAQISIRRGPTSGTAQWSPYALVSPTMVPLSTDRGGRADPQFLFGIKAIDGVAGTHAQVFGVLYQAGEASFIPSNQFGGTVSSSGSFTPGVTALLGYVGPTGTVLQGTGFTVAHPGTGHFVVTPNTPNTLQGIILADIVSAGGSNSTITLDSNLGFILETDVYIKTAGAPADLGFMFQYS